MSKLDIDGKAEKDRALEGRNGYSVR